MKILVLIFCLASVSLLHGETVGVAPHGIFEIDQESGDDGWTATIKSRDPKLPIVHLETFPWPGLYVISPNRKWILRIQKSGSGSNIGLLYGRGAEGQVSQIEGFDDRLWKTSDVHAPRKSAELYHRGIDSASWTKDGRTLSLSIRGSNSKRSGDGFHSRIEYDVKENAFSCVE